MSLACLVNSDYYLVGHRVHGTNRKVYMHYYIVTVIIILYKINGASVQCAYMSVSTCGCV